MTFTHRYVGADSLPARLSEFDVEQYFTLTKADVLALCERFRADRRVPAAILLLHLRASGQPLDRVAVPDHAGLSYLHVFTTQDGTTSVASIPVQVGKGDASLPAVGQLKSTPDGDKILSIPVKQP